MRLIALATVDGLTRLPVAAHTHGGEGEERALLEASEAHVGPAMITEDNPTVDEFTTSAECEA